jgi:hypothetical protein
MSRAVTVTATAMRMAGDKEGKGGKAMAMAGMVAGKRMEMTMKRAMATKTREAGKEEGNGKGSKSNGDDKWLLDICSIKDVYSTSKIPQSNAICERMHQTENNVLRALVHTKPPTNMTQACDIIDDAQATAIHAMQTTIATTLGSTPGAPAFA